MPTEPTHPSAARATEPGPRATVVAHHLRIGWVALLLFVSLGLALELLHGIKASFYLGVDHETRRQMFTLAHAHGVGLSLVHLGFAFTVGRPWVAGDRLGLTSQLLTWATVLIPGGFVLGGIVTHGGDPSIGVWLVPVGAAALWVAVLLTALATRRVDAPIERDRGPEPAEPRPDAPASPDTGAS